MRLASLLPLALALLRVDAQASSSSPSLRVRTSLYCKTALGTRPVSFVPTKTAAAVTYSTTATRRTTVTPLSIITPPPRTRTITVDSTVSTTTTLPTGTDTWTLSSTITVVQNHTRTYTYVSTYLYNITTTTSATVTVPTAPGFTPLARALRRMGFQATPAATQNNTVSPSLSARALIPQRHKRSDNKRPPVWPFGRGKHPTSVECAAIIRVTATALRTLQANFTATATLAPMVATSTTTRIVTTTIQVKPHNAVTATTTYFTTTVQKTTTSLVTSTATRTNVVVIAAPTQTKYAVCQPQNIVDKVNGKYIRGFTGDDNSFGGKYDLVTLPGITSAEACCIQCSQAPKGQCSTFVWSAPFNTCYLVYPDSEVCVVKKTIGTLLTGSGSPNEQVHVGNTNCGKVTYKGR